MEKVKFLYTLHIPKTKNKFFAERSRVNSYSSMSLALAEVSLKKGLQGQAAKAVDLIREILWEPKLQPGLSWVRVPPSAFLIKINI